MSEYDEGVEACKAGEHQRNCPYRAYYDTQKRIDWLSGYAHQAQEEADAAKNQLQSNKGKPHG